MHGGAVPQRPLDKHGGMFRAVTTLAVREERA
jgi:hypothetical protein